MISMTGFGRGAISQNNVKILCEISCVNHRNLDIKLKFGKELWQYEQLVYETIKKHFRRGHFDIRISIDTDKNESNLKARLDIKNAALILQDLKDLSNKNNELSHEITTGDLLALPNLFCFEQQSINDDQTTILLIKALDEAIKKTASFRKQDGIKTEKIIKKHLLNCQKYHAKIIEKSKHSASANLLKLKKRLALLLDSSDFDEQRLSQEIAIIADKSDISEEINRLNSHLNYFTKTMQKTTEVIGRKLDFICQEIFRETNTIASKSTSSDIAQLVVSLKSEVDKIREQVQNIE